MKNIFIGVFFSVVFSVMGEAHAQGGTGYRALQEFGCHLGDGTCYVSIEGPPVGPANCTGTSIRWNSQMTNGKHILALIIAAKSQNKKIDFYISPDCYSSQSWAPTFWYLNVES